MGRGFSGLLLGLCFTFWFAEYMPQILGLVLICCGGLAVCRHASIRCRPNFGFVYLVFMLLMCRLGEALNPGPNDFTLGAFNPSGLKGKASYIVSGIYGLSLRRISVTNPYVCSGQACTLHKDHFDTASLDTPFQRRITGSITLLGEVLL